MVVQFVLTKNNNKTTIQDLLCELLGRACVFELIFEGKINFDSSLMYNDMKIYSKSILNLELISQCETRHHLVFNILNCYRRVVF